MKVLLGIGGSPDSFLALSKGLERARAAGDELTVAILENPESDIDPAAVESQVRDEIDAADVDASIRRLSGDPGGALVELAEAEHFDAIALGGGEESPMGKIRLGSIAEFVILNSSVTVILLR